MEKNTKMIVLLEKKTSNFNETEKISYEVEPNVKFTSNLVWIELFYRN